MSRDIQHHCRRYGDEQRTHRIPLALAVTLVVVAGLLALMWLMDAPLPQTVRAQGTIHYVTPDGNCGMGYEPCYDNIQAAVDAAQSGDEIRVAAGFYPIAGSTDQVVCVDKDLVLHGGYATDNWDVPNPETNATELTAMGQGRVMVISGTIEVTVEGLRLTFGDSEGLGDGMPGGESGRGLYVFEATATLRHNWLLNNTAPAGYGLGGGVYVENTQALFEGNTIESNISVVDAGGAYLGGSKPITFRANLVRGNVAGDTLSGGDGAGVYVATSQAVLSGNVIQHNAATRRYGQGGSGGGLLIGPNADCTFANNVVTDNTGQTFGPGIAVFGAEPGLYHNTIANNTGGDGSGLYVAKGGMDDEPGRPTLYNTIIASQTLGVNVSDDDPQNLTTMYGVLWWRNTEDITGTVFAFDEVAGVPAFVDPAGYDYHVSPGSAAIDVGGTDAGITEDIDGQGRPHYDGYDLDADEAWAVMVVKSAAPGVAGSEDAVTYTIALTNTTDGPMMIFLTDTLPSQVEYVGPITYTGGSVGLPTGIVTWTGIVLTDTPALIAWPVKIASDVSLGVIIPNTVTVRDAYGFFQTEPALIVVPQGYHYIYLPLVLRD